MENQDHQHATADERRAQDVMFLREMASDCEFNARQAAARRPPARTFETKYHERARRMRQIAHFVETNRINLF